MKSMLSPNAIKINQKYRKFDLYLKHWKYLKSSKHRKFIEMNRRSLKLQVIFQVVKVSLSVSLKVYCDNYLIKIMGLNLHLKAIYDIM